VSVTAEQWEVLAVVAGGAPVDAVAQALTLGEFGACQVVKRLVDSGLVEVEDTTAHFAATAAMHAGDIDHLVEIPKRRRRATDAPEPDEPETPVRTLADARAARDAQQQMENELLGNQEEIDAAMAALSPEKARALASELGDLGTDAADAVAAAARATTPEERAAALKGVLTDEHGEPINRGLLLKFLSSVRS
jgi:ABC-type xylose transport system substrate-binding protein